ncbi:MAG: DUF1284 domain-containing protein [Rickettsiales bacterium]|nr:DUF1284 domain-containing protein [Rickettsiales bacterium]
MQKIILRPHHINCIFFFEGKGYSEEFIKNMTDIISNLNENIIKFQFDCDCLCSKCPNKVNSLCKDEEHIKLLDRLTIENYNLDLNKQYCFDELINYFYRNFDTEKFKKICNSCEWYKNGVCSVEKININKKKYKN